MMTRRRGDGRRFSNALAVTSLATSASATVCAVYAVITAIPDDLVFPDADHVASTGWMVVSLAIGSLVTAVVAVVGRRLRPIQIEPIVATACLALAVVAYLAIFPLRKRISEDLSALTGPGHTPTTRFFTVAVALSLASFITAVYSLGRWAGERDTTVHRRPPVVITALAAVVVMLVTGGWTALWTHNSSRDGGPLAGAATHGVPRSAPALQDAQRVAYRIPVASGHVATAADAVLIVDDGAVAARDLQTGAVRWTRDRTGLSGEGASLRDDVLFIVEHARSESTAVVVLRGRTTAIDVDTGAIRWWSDASMDVIGGDDGVVVAARYVKPTRATTERGSGDGVSLVGLDARTGRTRWTDPLTDDGDCRVQGAVLDGHALYTGCGAGLRTLDVATGLSSAVRQKRTNYLIDLAGSTFLVNSYDGADTTSYEFFRPGAARPVAPPVIDKPQSGIVDGSVVGERRLPGVNAKRTLAIIDPATATTLPVDLEPDSAFIAGPPVWTEHNGILYGPAQEAGTNDYSPVIATIDPRTRKSTSVSSPCLRGAPHYVRPIMNRILVQCSDFNSTSAPTVEIVGLQAR